MPMLSYGDRRTIKKDDKMDSVIMGTHRQIVDEQRVRDNHPTEKIPYPYTLGSIMKTFGRFNEEQDRINEEKHS